MDRLKLICGISGIAILMIEILDNQISHRAGAHLDIDPRIARRLKLRDLHWLTTVVKIGSMARAAGVLSASQPAISQAIADLEDTVGVPLLERGPRGVTPTAYGQTLLKWSTEAFDALGQGLRDIRFQATDGVGEVWVGASESHVAGGFLADIVARLSRAHPHIAIHVIEANTVSLLFDELRERKVDLMLGRISSPLPSDDLLAEKLFDEAIQVVAGSANPLARKRKLRLADLAEEPWILAPPNTVVNDLVMKAFRAEGLEPPRLSVTTYSMQLRMQLLASGNYLTVLPESAVRFNAGRWPIRALPVRLGEPLPVVAVRLRHRTPSPAVSAFLEVARGVTRK